MVKPGVLGSAAALVAVAALGGCQPSSGEGQEAASPESGAAASGFARVVNVRLRAVQPTEFTSYVRLTGAVEANADVVVSAEESGSIQRFYVEKGTAVGAGQPLAKIDDRSLTAQVNEARALASLAEERFERQRRLWEDEEIGSEIAFLQAKYDADAAAARLENLQVRLDRTVIRAPIRGVFDARYVDVGEMVAPGVPIGRLLEVRRVKVVGGVPERFGPLVREGREARVAFDVLPGQTFDGGIGYVGAAVDEASRTFPIEIVLDNPDRVIKPQMVANIEVATERLQDVIVVPQDVVLRTETGYQVFVAVDRDGQRVAEARDVRLGPSFADQVVIAEGLAAGDELVVAGHQLVDPGDRLRVVAEVEAP